MPAGFFPESTLLAKKAPPSQYPQCEACGLYKTCADPKQEPYGENRKGVLFVGRAPNEAAEERGRPLAGKWATDLGRILADYDFDLFKDGVVTNSLICRPPATRTGEGVPTQQQAEFCRPNFLKAVDEYDPHTIIPLGTAAMQTVVGHVWSGELSTVQRWQGYDIPCQQLNRWICPTIHPADCLRDKDGLFELYFRKHLEQALKHSAKPFANVPDRKSKVRVIESDDEAIALIKKVYKQGRPFAFDYETNSLKPDHERAAIISCSLHSPGVPAFAFVFTPPTAKALARLLWSDVPKIASNLKFEDRWTRSKLGRPVNGWLWDTMLGAHVDDNRQSVCSVKFQAFVLLGEPLYDEHIKSLLKEKKGALVNRILEEISVRDLLVYNALDSFVEYDVAVEQTKTLDRRIYKCLI